MPEMTHQELVEKELGVGLPTDYIEFLNKYGIYEDDGIEIYGIDDEVKDINKIPCVIGATKTFRTESNLPHHYIAIQHTGYEDELICLDTKSGTIHSLSFEGEKKIADSFREWFSQTARMSL
jgi:hypothetical protein